MNPRVVVVGAGMSGILAAIKMREAAKRTIWSTCCKSRYLDASGLPRAWPWTFRRFRDEMARPRLDDFDLR